MIVRYPLVRTTKKDYAWDSYFAWQHLKIGLPMAFQFSITAIGVVVLQGALNIFGAVKIAGYTAAQKVEQLTVGVASTLGVTMANYTGQNLGAGDLNRIKQGTNIGTSRHWFCSSVSRSTLWPYHTFSSRIGNYHHRSLRSFRDRYHI